jgi:DNA transformation protein
MARAHSEFVLHCLELLAPAGAASARSMFGGHGITLDGLFVALVAFERLYLKVDAQTRPRFEAAGCEPFVYEGKGRAMTMSYFTVPEDAMESPVAMQPWARLAIEAALRARAPKPPAARKKPAAKRRSTQARAR